MQLALAEDWQIMSPADAGFAPDLGARLDAAVRRGKLANLHAVVVARRDRLVPERYDAGPSAAANRPTA